MVVAGALALIYPLLASVAMIYLLAWVLIVSGAVQAIGLIGARHVPHYWLQLISVVLAILIGVLLWTTLLSLPYIWIIALFSIFAVGTGLVLTGRTSPKWQNP